MILDLLLASIVVALVVWVGLRRHEVGAGPLERFTAGRQVSWLTLGMSLAASATSADTPLLVAGAVYMDGFSGNWFWWSGAPGFLATLFFFARLWRRSGVITEIEIFKLRYGGGRAARYYRISQAILEGVLLNVPVLASNGYAFALILNAMLKRWHIDPHSTTVPALTITCFLIAAGHALLAGFRGLAKSNAAEFLISILAGTVLAIVAIAGLPAGLASLYGVHAARGGTATFTMWPAHDHLAPLLLLTLGWWQSAPGRNMLVQRVVASRDERAATRTVATFVVFHFLIRPWGWYVIGAAALFYLPAHSNPDFALPALAGALLPPGLFGVILAVTALSFIGCINSRLNYGASYLVNDVALALNPTMTARSTRLLEIAVVAGLTVMAMLPALLGYNLNIRALYQFLTMVMAGRGFVAIARWYWWRTTILCEIASLVSSAVIAIVTLLVADISQPSDFAIAVAVNFAVGLVVTVGVAYAGRPTSEHLLRNFYDRTAPNGPGWRAFGASPSRELPTAMLQWLLANIMLFSIIFAGIRALAGDVRATFLAIAITTLSAGVFSWLPRLGTASGQPPVLAPASVSARKDPGNR